MGSATSFRKEKKIDPAHNPFFRNGYAEFFLARRGKKIVGTIAWAEDFNNTQSKGRKECMIGFFECVNDYAVAEALFDHATAWARQRNMVSLYGTFHLDREDSRGILIEGRDRPQPFTADITRLTTPNFSNAMVSKKMAMMAWLMR